MNITPELLTAMAGIPLGSIAIYLMYKISANHINHNTAVIAKLSEVLNEQTKVHVEFYGWMRGRESLRAEREIASDARDIARDTERKNDAQSQEARKEDSEEDGKQGRKNRKDWHKSSFLHP